MEKDQEKEVNGDPIDDYESSQIDIYPDPTEYEDKWLGRSDGCYRRRSFRAAGMS